VRERLDRQLVALMFTDIVGYTALMQADERLGLDKRDRYMRALEAHHDAFGGTIVKRMGDGTMSNFPSSLAAVLAGVAIQRELAAQEVPVRIGIHVGEVIVEPGDMLGDAVNIASRIESFAVPGGVMLSDSAYDQVKNRSEVGVVSLGRFRLKNVGRPFDLYAVSAEGIVVPDPRALEGKGERFASLPSNLPDPATPLLGRAADLASLIEIVRVHPVVTITGPGGVGKTRIVIELGRLLTPEFLDGLAFIALADLTDAAEFLPALAVALDVKEAEGRTLGDGVVSLIGDKKALLLLDNLEQVVLAAPAVAGLVQSCPGLRVVTTSRAPLRIAAEREYPLAPLGLPQSVGPGSTEPTASLLAHSAIALFVERGRTARGSFELTPENAGTLLPSADAWTACRWPSSSPPPDSGSCPPKPCSSGSTGPWTYSLLDLVTVPSGTGRCAPRSIGATRSSPPRSSACSGARPSSPGGCTLVDLEAVCAGPDETLLDELESLVDKALVQVDGQGERFRMLETIRQYARERLEAAAEVSEEALKHARRYAAVAGEIRDGMEGARQVASLERGIAEEGNLQAALDTLLASARDGNADAGEQGMQMCGDLMLYWHVRGKNLSAREYATSFVSACIGGTPTAGRAGAFLTAALASWVLGELERANEEWAEAYRVAAELGADRELCLAACLQGVGLLGFDLQAALRWTGESIERRTPWASPGPSRLP
jgi:class 3 adenylate cyclase/predicted ATPase